MRNCTRFALLFLGILLLNSVGVFGARVAVACIVPDTLPRQLRDSSVVVSGTLSADEFGWSLRVHRVLKGRVEQQVIKLRFNIVQWAPQPSPDIGGRRVVVIRELADDGKTALVGPSDIGIWPRPNETSFPDDNAYLVPFEEMESLSFDLLTLFSLPRNEEKAASLLKMIESRALHRQLAALQCADAMSDPTSDSPWTTVHPRLIIAVASAAHGLRKSPSSGIRVCVSSLSVHMPVSVALPLLGEAADDGDSRVAQTAIVKLLSISRNARIAVPSASSFTEARLWAKTLQKMLPGVLPALRDRDVAALLAQLGSTDELIRQTSDRFLQIMAGTSVGFAWNKSEQRDNKEERAKWFRHWGKDMPDDDFSDGSKK